MTKVLKTKNKIVFLDEVNFTKNTLLKRAYSAKGQNIEIEQSAIYGGYWSVIAAISTESKIEHLFFRPKAINQDSFCEFLIELKRKLKHEKVPLFMD